jgi:hypothetical protein
VSSKLASEQNSDALAPTTSVRVTIGATDLNNLKHKKWFGKGEDTTFIIISNATIQDMAGNRVEPIGRSSPLQIRGGGFTPDTTPPRLATGNEFSLDLNTDTLILNFDETIDFETVDLTKISVLARPNASATESFIFTGPNYLMSPQSFEDLQTSVRVLLLSEDLNKIKQKTGLAVTDATTVLSLSRNAIFDTADVANGIEEVASSTGVSHANDHVEDGIPPVLLSFVLDLNRGEIELEFSETVDSSTLLVERLRLQSNASSVPVELRKFGIPTKAISAPATKVVVEISEADLNDIKAKTNLGTSGTPAGDTFLAVQSGAVKDMNGNGAIPT